MRKRSLLLLIILFMFETVRAQEFRVNLGGYLPALSKTALFLSKNLDFTGNYELRSVSDPDFLFKPNVVETSNWQPFSKTYLIDFGILQEPGIYYLLETHTDVKSPEFSIDRFPSWQNEVVQFMQSQRCGFNPHLGTYCHQKDGLSFFGKVPDSTQIDARGGWHDAGDQLKYLITGSNATARMLQAWIKYPESFHDMVDSRGLAGKNGLADVLDEAKWGLNWILNLHPTSDVLYHQVADDRDHRGFKMPDQDNADYGWGVNSFRPVYAATGTPQGLGKYLSKADGFANLAGRSTAALALGYQVFSQIPGENVFAQSCLQAAKELYELGKINEGFQQGNSYGAPYRYEENTWADDMEWAAAELYKVTRQKNYLKDARRYAKVIRNWSWMQRDTASHYEMYPFVNMGHYALWQAGNKKDKKLTAGFYRENLSRIKAKAAVNPYGVGHLFIWCSNNLAAAVATQSLLYEEMTGSQEFHPLLVNHANWLLGLNPWGTSMITGLPENRDWPLNVHMPFWKLRGEVIRGSLVDGPLWTTIHDGMLAIELSEKDEYAEYQPPHLRYHDDFADYSTNEPTMDGSADLILLLTYLNQGK